MGVAAHFTIVLVFLAIGLPALIYACISYFGQAKQDTRIDMEALNLQQETNARTAKDMQLMTQLAQETTNRITQVTQETNNRIASDAALNASIAVLRATPVVNSINNLTDSNVTFVGGAGLNLNVTNNSTIVIGLQNTTVIPGRYIFPTLMIDPDGRISNATNGTIATIPAVTLVNSGVGLTGGPINSTGTLSLANTTVVPGNYIFPLLSINARGQITSASNNTAVTTVTGGTGLNTMTMNTPTTVSTTLSISSTGVSPGSYVNPSFVVNAQGQLTSATNNSLVLGGDVSGNLSTTTVNSIQGVPISAAAVTNAALSGSCGSGGTYVGNFVSPFGVYRSFNSRIFTKTNHAILNLTSCLGIVPLENYSLPSSICQPNGCAVTACFEFTAVQSGGGGNVQSDKCYFFTTISGVVTQFGGPSIRYNAENIASSNAQFRTIAGDTNVIQFVYDAGGSFTLSMTFTYKLTFRIAPRITPF